VQVSNIPGASIHRPNPGSWADSFTVEQNQVGTGNFTACYPMLGNLFITMRSFDEKTGQGVLDQRDKVTGMWCESVPLGKHLPYTLDS
jgi:hypothetical protein